MLQEKRPDLESDAQTQSQMAQDVFHACAQPASSEQMVVSAGGRSGICLEGGKFAGVSLFPFRARFG